MSTPTFEPDVFVNVTREQYLAWLAAGQPTSGPAALPAGAVPITAEALNRLGAALAVLSVNVADAATAAALQALSGQVTTLSGQVSANTSAITGKYAKPSGGIPLSDLASAVVAYFATPAQVDARIQAIINGAPAALDTLGEIAAQLAADESAAAAIAGRLTSAEGNITANASAIAGKTPAVFAADPAFTATYAQTATLELTYPQRVPAAVGKLFAGLAARLTAPCRIAFLGSSTPAGTGATTINDRWTSRFIANLQGLYPSGLSTETAVIYSTTADFGTLSTAAGVHGYNAAEGGLNSGEYLTSTEASKIGALNPRAVLHQVGSNDMGDGITPAQYKTNVLAAIAAIKAATSGPCVHVLIHGHERYDKATTYPWTAYQAVLFEIAAADPDNVVALDLTRTFSRVGVPNTDPLVLMNADKIHLTDAGHSLTADLVRRGLGLVAATPVPVVATSGATVTAARLTSETATGSTTEINTRSSDVGLGGAARAWVAEPASAQVAVSGGSIVRGSGTLATFFAGWANTAADLEFGFTIGAAPTGGTLFVDIQRAATTGSPDAYRLQVTAAGGLQLSKRVGGGTTALGAASSFTAGDRIVIRRIGTTLAFRRNGTTIVGLTDTSISAAGFCGFAGAASLTAMNIKNVTLDALTL